MERHIFDRRQWQEWVTLESDRPVPDETAAMPVVARQVRAGSRSQSPWWSAALAQPSLPLFRTAARKPASHSGKTNIPRLHSAIGGRSAVELEPAVCSMWSE